MSDLLDVLRRCLEREHNPFEPDNQSDLYHAVDRIIYRLETRTGAETLVADLLADELPGDRQYVREARTVLADLRHRAAARIKELEDYSLLLERQVRAAVEAAQPLWSGEVAELRAKVKELEGD
jgi:hypothetical protein